MAEEEGVGEKKKNIKMYYKLLIAEFIVVL